MSSGASWIIGARSHLSLAVMNAETLDVDGVRLLWKCMEMSLGAAFSQPLPPSLRLWCVISQTARLVFHYSSRTGKRERGGAGLRQRGDRVGRRGGGYRWQSLYWVAELSVTYLMSFMHARNLLCVLGREAHNIIHNAWIHFFRGIKMTLQEI